MQWIDLKKWLTRMIDFAKVLDLGFEIVSSDSDCCLCLRVFMLTMLNIYLPAK